MNLDYKPPGGPISEMNLTPLIDVMMVLMIIFMITSPLDPAGIDLDLPLAASSPLPRDDKKITIFLNKNSIVSISQGDKPPINTDLENVKNMLLKNFPGLKEANIKADRNLKYQHVITLLMNVKSAGFTKIGLVTTDEETK
jgi:biopolymer transport protein ExbD